MTIADDLVYVSMPLGGLILGAIVSWQQRRDTAKYEAKYRR